jgi:hypothetical protein
MITLREFHNGLRILRAIDAHELGDPEWYPRFAREPYRFLISCDDGVAQKIWDVMVARGVQRNSRKGAAE